MAAITWQNVDAPRFTDPSNSMVAAGQMMGNAFSGLQDILKQREATINTNFDQEKIGNFRTDMRDLMSLDTVEKLAAAKASGHFDKVLASRAGMTDQDAYMKAVSARMPALQKSETDAINYATLQRTEHDRPLRTTALGMGNQNYQGAVDYVNSSGMVDKGSVLAELYAQKTANDNNVMARKAQEANIAQSYSAAAANTANAESTRAQKEATIKASNFKLAQESKAAHLTQSNNLFAGGIGNTDSAPDVMKALVDNLSIPDRQKGTMKSKLDGLMRSGVTIKSDDGTPATIHLPKSVLMSMVSGTEDGTLSPSFKDYSAKSFQTKVDDYLKDPVSLLKLRTDYAEYQKLIGQKDVLATGLPKPTPATPTSTPVALPTRTKPVVQEVIDLPAPTPAAVIPTKASALDAANPTSKANLARMTKALNAAPVTPINSISDMPGGAMYAGMGSNAVDPNTLLPVKSAPAKSNLAPSKEDVAATTARVKEILAKSKQIDTNNPDYSLARFDALFKDIVKENKAKHERKS